MGNLLGKAMEDNMKKQQAFMLETQQMQIERQIELQNYMREQQMAMQIATNRDHLHFFAAFYAVGSTGSIILYLLTRKPRAILPLLPMTFTGAYLIDRAYYRKVERIQADARQMIEKQRSQVKLPTGLPSIEILDKRRNGK